MACEESAKYRWSRTWARWLARCIFRGAERGAPAAERTPRGRSGWPGARLNSVRTKPVDSFCPPVRRPGWGAAPYATELRHERGAISSAAVLTEARATLRGNSPISGNRTAGILGEHWQIVSHFGTFSRNGTISQDSEELLNFKSVRTARISWAAGLDPPRSHRAGVCGFADARRHC